MQNITINRIDELDFQGAEAYKTLRTNIQFSGEDIKVISVTSCMPNEGKSSVSMNLAISLTEAGKNVLLIDADMRKSVLVGKYKIKNVKKGLSHYLSGQSMMEEIISITNIERFHMILSGPVPPNPSELLGSKRYKSLIKELRGIYDYIIVDCPPIGSVVDAMIAGNISDGVALVIAAEQVSYKFAQKVKEQLEQGNCKILGVILNKVSMKNRKYYSHYYGKYYGKNYNSYYGHEEA